MVKVKELSEEGGDGLVIPKPKKQKVVEEEKSTETQMVGAVANNESTSKCKFYLMDLKLLDCSICRRPQRLSSPVNLCMSGKHVSCLNCVKNLNWKCTQCCVPIIYMSCDLIEKLMKTIRRSCENMNYGCQETVTGSTIDHHETHCSFAPCPCPIEGCNFVGSLMQLSAHVSSKHSDTVAHFCFDHLYTISLKPNETFCVLQETNDGELFVLNNVKYGVGNMVSASRIALRSCEKLFSIELQFKDGEEVPLRLTTQIKSIQSRVGHQPSIYKDFLLVPNGFFHGEELELVLRISRSAV